MQVSKVCLKSILYLICQCYVKILSIIFVSIHVSMYMDKFIKKQNKKTTYYKKKSMWNWWRQKKKIKVQWEIILFVCGFSSHSRIFHSYGEVNITCEGLLYLTHVWHMSIKQWWFFNVSHLRWHGTSVYTGHLRGSVTLTPIA